MKRAFIVHGWGGYPGEGWFAWLKEQLESKGFRVQVPSMPDPERPVISDWISHLKKIVGSPDEDTFLIGHSIGCQTILRYLDSLPEGVKVGGVFLVAGWVNLTEESYEDDEDRGIAKPWLETPINWEKVKSHSDNFTAVFSDNDPFVPLSDSEIFKEKLEAKVIIEHEKSHFSGEDGIKELPVVLEEFLSISK